MGWFHPRPSNLRLRQPALGTDMEFRSVPLRDRSLDSPFYYGVRISTGVGRPQRIRVELEFIHAKVYASDRDYVDVHGRWLGEPARGKARLGEYLQSFSISHGLNFLFVNLAKELWPLGRRLAVWARCGVGAIVPHVESRVLGVSRQGYELEGPAGQLSLCITYGFGRRWLLISELKSTLAVLRAGEVYRGHVSGRFTGFHLVVGLSRAIGG